MSLLEQIHVFRKEVALRLPSIATQVLLISLLVLALGLLWEEQYESSTTILVDDDKIIGPLLQGATVPTNVLDQAEAAREVLFSRQVLEEVIDGAGWVAPGATLLEREEIMEQIKADVEVESVGGNLLEIRFRNSDPERAFRTVLLLSNLFIGRAREAKYAESRQAYEFISAEAQRYQEKLRESEQRLQRFLAGNGNVGPGTGELIDDRVAELMRGIQATALDLEEARVRVRSLQSQLSSESATAASITREEQLYSMIAELQVELDQLRLRYHDTYPDIISAKHKIATLQQQLEREQDRRMNGAPPDGVAGIDGVALNPLHQEIRAQLSVARTQVAALEKRLERNQQWLREMEGRGVEIADVEAEAAELTRDYEVTKEIYEDLLKRREAARIAVNMDEGGEGLSMSIQEPPTVPLTPAGIRFMHFALLAPFLGGAMALGAVFARVRFDERIRSGAAIARELHIPVLATVPMLADDRARARQRRAWGTVVTAGLLLVASYAFVAVLRLNDFI